MMFCTLFTAPAMLWAAFLWRASAGRVDSVDLRFARQVVVNSEARTVADHPVQSAPQRAQHVRKRR